MPEKASKKNEVVLMPRQSQESFQTVLVRWLSRFGEHYRQPMSPISVDCYRELLSDLTPAQLDAACRHAMRISEFMPTVATIRKALRELEDKDPPSTFERYPEVSPDERILSEEDEAQMAELKKKLGLIARTEVSLPASKPKTIYTPRSTPKPIEEQKAELRKRGLL